MVQEVMGDKKTEANYAELEMLLFHAVCKGYYKGKEETRTKVIDNLLKE